MDGGLAKGRLSLQSGLAVAATWLWSFLLLWFGLLELDL
jgi:hypothetical protein